MLPLMPAIVAFGASFGVLATAAGVDSAGGDRHVRHHVRRLRAVRHRVGARSRRHRGRRHRRRGAPERPLRADGAGRIRGVSRRPRAAPAGGPAARGRELGALEPRRQLRHQGPARGRRHPLPGLERGHRGRRARRRQPRRPRDARPRRRLPGALPRPARPAAPRPTGAIAGRAPPPRSARASPSRSLRSTPAGDSGDSRHGRLPRRPRSGEGPREHRLAVRDPGGHRDHRPQGRRARPRRRARAPRGRGPGGATCSRRRCSQRSWPRRPSPATSSSCSTNAPPASSRAASRSCCALRCSWSCSRRPPPRPD